MRKNRILIVMMSVFFLMMLSPFTQAATITTCTFDKESYNPGQTGYVTVTVYNDEESKIRVFELTATIDYYYNDDNVYLQTFFTNPDPPTEIQQGQSDTFQIQFSLPTNIAPGYTTLLVKAKTEIWSEGAQRWQGSDHPTYQPTMYIESPYKQQYEDQQVTNTNLQNDIRELQAINGTTTSLMYLFTMTTVVFAIVTVLFVVLSRRQRMLSQAAT